ncbi:MAG TPA: 16S rRNA (adenine(1518)-N(6)/adenine(1519)-N(6))-dimethyltransferase RsmA [Candidatus Tectomicrobia bacterium]|jgi:16S rRNA (adenine1518-N6/adenine1519-N6)-dimethyltransferase
MRRHTRASTQRRKRLGQIFLRDPLVVEGIVASAQLTPHTTVLEIGPGRGALTIALAQQVGGLYAIEIDAAYADDLQRRLVAMPHVHIIQADARRYDYGQLPEPLVVVANLPYSMGLAILRHLFVFRTRLSRLIVMLQREVATRLLAPPGASAYSAVSVFFQYYADIHHCLEVSRHAFTPVPAVDSTVLALVPFTPLPWPSSDEHFFLQVVKCAFAHRRKTLRANLLAAQHLSLTRASLADIFTTLHLMEQVRPQELHVAQFVQLAEALHSLLLQSKTASGGEL